MTMSVELLREAARRLEPGRIPVTVEGVVASTWLYAEPAVDVDIACTPIDADRILVSIGTFLEGKVTMADRFPEAPPPSAEPLGELADFPVAVEDIYRDGWLFHGPQYQGVVAIDAFGTNGMRGTLTALPAKGALLDAAGQVYGLWVLGAVETDRLAMPVRIGRIEFFAPDPPPGATVVCNVWKRHLGRREVRADLELLHEGRLYARISNWEDWRFETGGGIYAVMRKPARNLLATVDPAGFAVVTDPGWRTATLEYLARRFLTNSEIEAADGMRRALRQRDWVIGRIAAKDAVRHHLMQHGSGPVFPAEIAIAADAAGRPRVAGAWAGDLRVSIAHKDGIACAIVADGRDPGIDIEKIESRGEGFAGMAFGPDEMLRLPPADRDEWTTRLWAAKEAAGKANGTGLAGNPKGLTLAALDGERMLIDGRWIETRRDGDYIIAWTQQ
jgi:phosphopantetheinyl transferase